MMGLMLRKLQQRVENPMLLFCSLKRLLLRRPKTLDADGVVYYGRFYPAHLMRGNAKRFIEKKALKWCKGYGIDVGAGKWPLPGAIPVDKTRTEDAYHLDRFADESLDFVFSSHCLEHLRFWRSALALWVSKLKIGGILFLYVPHPDMKLWHPREPWVGTGHKWIVKPEKLLPFLKHLGLQIIETQTEPDDYYSWYVVARRVRRVPLPRKHGRTGGLPPAKGLREFVGRILGFLGTLITPFIAGPKPHLNPQQALRRARTVLILELHGIGDTVMSLPCYHALRRHKPDARIIAIAKPSNGIILQKAGVVDEVLEFDPRWDVANRGYIRGLLQGFRSLFSVAPHFMRLRGRVDVALSLYPDIRYWWVMFLLGAPFRIAPVTDVWQGRCLYSWRGLLMDALLCPGNVHYAEHKSRVVASLGIEVDPTAAIIRVAPDEKEAGRRLLAGVGVRKGPIALIHPGASRPIRCWPADRFASLIKYLTGRNFSVVIMSGPSDEEQVKAVCAHLKRKVPIVRPNFEQVFGLLAVADLFVCHDSGLMHLANAIGTPTAAIFGLGLPRFTSPVRQAPFVAVEPEGDFPCRPCGYLVCPRRIRCIETITVDRVIAAVENLLRE